MYDKTRKKGGDHQNTINCANLQFYTFVLLLIPQILHMHRRWPNLNRNRVTYSLPWS